MNTLQTLTRLRDLKLGGMAAALEHQQNQPGTYDELSFTERLELLLDREFQTRDHRKQDRLVRQARFKLRASVQDIDYQHPRNLKKTQVAQLAQAKADGTYHKALNQLAKVKLLILDDWGLEALKPAHRNDLMEIMDDRHGTHSTMIISQLPTDQWYAAIGDNTLADAILDRLMHNAHRWALKGESMRKRLQEID
jgi:DNA replication protein DnaC